MENRQEKYRVTFFGSPIGKEVLGDMLSECGFGTSIDADNHAQVAAHNLCMLILNRCGVLGNGTLPKIVNAFAGIRPDEQQQAEDEI